MISKHSNGFTLIEVMVALTTLAVALLAAMQLYLSSIRADTRNREESLALFLANQKVEELRSLDFESVEKSVQGYECESGCGCDNIDGYFLREWCFTAPQAWRKNIVVTVTWWEKIKFLNGAPPPQDKQRRVQVATVLVQLD